MARYFSEQDIDEFRDCFYLMTLTKNGHITTIDELKTIMRSLQMSPTIPELNTYFKDKGGNLSFADFLDVMHTHSVKEKCHQEILDAFRASDTNKCGQIRTRDLKHILTRWGEKLDQKEVELLFKETNSNKPVVKYEDFVRVICDPMPDY